MIIRRATAADAEAAGRICFAAFAQINQAHGFPSDVNEAASSSLLSMLFSAPGCSCWVAEEDGRIIGSNCLSELDAIFGIGPITIDPAAQNSGAGRALMRAALERVRECQAPGVRLVQAAFHNRSLSLYTKLDFVAREPLSVMQGPPIRQTFNGINVRFAQPDDIDACNRVCLQVHGHTRGNDLAHAVSRGSAKVVERDGRVTGYSSAMAFAGHAVAESNRDLLALIADAAAFEGPGVLVPTRNTEVFRWCLERGLRVVEPMTLMTIGLYNEPVGAYLCSILY